MIKDERHQSSTGRPRGAGETWWSDLSNRVTPEPMGLVTGLVWMGSGKEVNQG